MCVQWCVPADPGSVLGELDPADADEDGDDDELGDAEDDVVDVVDTVPAVPDPPVDASATPVTPAPTAAATTPVIMSRRARPPILETIGVPPFATAAAVAAGSSQELPCAVVLLLSRNGALRPL
jgi:hypothetical protein